MFSISYFLLTGLIFLISFLVSNQLKRKFKFYSNTALKNGMSGAEIASKMLADNQIFDVRITCVDGELSDHYNPINKTVNLSEAVYHGRSTAAAAVAAHECGHAVQHARAYNMLTFRSKLVPIQNISANILNYAMIGLALIGGFAGGIKIALLAIVICYAVITLFSLVTLPVEFDASKRAIAWMKDYGIVEANEYEGAKDSLKWAALTYVVAAIGSILYLLYFLMQYLGANDD